MEKRNMMIVDGKLTQDIANYLGTKPYHEVAPFLDALKQTPMLPIERVQEGLPELFPETQQAPPNRVPVEFKGKNKKKKG